MAFLRQLVLGGLMMAGTVGLGVAVMALVVPRDQREQELVKELPEANPLQLAERRRQNELIMAAIKEAAETNENVAWRQKPWSK
uniref:Ubiquinol-cytochrome-c reductase complex assembly factor 3 n=1 Tax=Pelusios castaneus TaxID=367368 RepID=A0A8C8RTV4_9SAUR